MPPCLQDIIIYDRIILTNVIIIIINDDTNISQMMMVMPRLICTHRQAILTKDESSPVSRATRSALRHDDDMSQHPRLDARTTELLVLLETACEMDDDDMRQILEAELFACDFAMGGGRHDV